MSLAVTESTRCWLAALTGLLFGFVCPAYAQPKWELTGQVVDHKGAPIAGAEVRLDYYAPDNVVAKSGGDGRFRLEDLEADTATVIVAAEGRSPSITTLKAAEVAGEVRFPLQLGHVLRVRVLDSAGNAIEGVRVLGDDWGDSALLVRLTTNREGRLEWASAPGDAVEYMIHKPGFCRLVNVKLFADGTEHVIKLWRPLRISGHVVDAATDQAIDRFTVIPVLRFHSDSSVVQRKLATEGRAGGFSVLVQRADTDHALRIEADGYRSAITPYYRVGQEDPACVMTLDKAPPVRASYRTPNKTLLSELESIWQRRRSTSRCIRTERIRTTAKR